MNRTEILHQAELKGPVVHRVAAEQLDSGDSPAYVLADIHSRPDLPRQFNAAITPGGGRTIAEEQELATAAVDNNITELQRLTDGIIA